MRTIYVLAFMALACGNEGDRAPGARDTGLTDTGLTDTAPPEAPEPCEPAPGPLEALPTRELPRGYSLADYTQECAAQLGEVPEIDCYEGTLIPMTVTTSVPTNALGEATGPGTTVDATRQSELEGGLRCDRPYQIGLGDENAGAGRSTSCIPHSRIGLRMGRDPQGRPTEFVYICRTYFFRTPDARGHVRYDDLGMIGYNPATGATCFWAVPINANPPGQSVTRDRSFDLDRLPRPGEDPNFWKPIGDLARSRCMGCHTNDPFIRSPVVEQTGVLPSHPQEPYWAVAGDRLNALARSSGPTREWNSHQALSTPAFMPCTNCHRLSRGLICDTLLPGATGISHSGSTSRAFASIYPLNRWMSNFDPEVLRMMYSTREVWTNTYSETVSGIRDCCRNPSAEGCEWTDIAGAICCALPDGSRRRLDADACAQREGRGSPPAECMRARCP